MRPASSNGVSEEAVVPTVAIERVPESASATLPAAAGLELCDLTVLEAVLGESEPVTPRRVAKLTDIPPAQLFLALETLCELGLLRRLNTVVESYTARFQ